MNGWRFCLLVYCTTVFLLGWWQGLLLMCLLVPYRSRHVVQMPFSHNT
jgi:hypothetical protein